MEKESSASSLLFRIRSLSPALSRAERQVADYIMSSPNDVLRLSVSGLAKHSNVSGATVIRTCRSLGFDNYHDFKITLAQDTILPLQSINEEISPGDSLEIVVDKVFQEAIHTLNFTHDTMKATSIDAAASAIMSAKRIYAIGLGFSHAVALDLQHKLLRLGLTAFAFVDTHHQALAATFLTPDDVLFAISLSGRSSDIVDCAKLAKEAGATVISLTDIGQSPLKKYSDIKLQTASNETKYRFVGMNSRIAQFTIINAVYTLIAMRTPNLSEKFQQIEKSIQSKKV